MGRVLCVGTYGSRDPTRAIFPFAAALTAIAAGHQPQIALMGDATWLMKDSIAARVQGADWPPLKDLLQKVIEHGVPMFV